MKALFSNIRAWKNRVFPDWLWDLLVGTALTVFALIAWAVQVSSFDVHVEINQFGGK